MVGLTDPPPPPPPQRLSSANTIPIGTSGASRDAGKGVIDPIAQGFDMMRERFDKLESRLDRTDQRVDDLEIPEDYDHGPGYTHGEEDDWEFGDPKGKSRRDFDMDNRNPNLGLRNRWGQGRSR